MMPKGGKSLIFQMIMGLTIAIFANTNIANAGETAAGEKVFKKCKSCHVIGKNKIGPDLLGLFDRPAASVEGYKYSKAMKASGIIWTEENLATFLKKPKAFVPKTKMGFSGLKKDQQIQDLLAYLKEATSK